MEITIRNITKDTMVDFNNDHTITLPMDEEKLRNMLGNDEWIIVDGEDDFCILAKAFIPKEAMEIEDYTIIDFNGETSQYNGGNGVCANDEWFGRVLHDLGYINFPFTYTEEMEDYVIWDQLWYTANSEGWVNIRYNGNTYLVKKW